MEIQINSPTAPANGWQEILCLPEEDIAFGIKPTKATDIILESRPSQDDVN